MMMLRHDTTTTGTRIALLAVALAAAMAACGPAQSTGDPQGPGAQGGRSEPQYGGVFHFPVTGNNPNLNPYSTRGSPQSLPNTIYETLVVRDLKPGVNWFEHGRLAPRLAERWERKDNTYTFQLRKGVTWHDGTPFTSADVIHTFEYLRDNRGKVSDAARVLNIARVEAVDALTVRLVTNKTAPDFLVDDILNIEITAKHVSDKGEALETTAIGTGPFKLKAFETSTGWTVERHDNYWVTGLPYLDGIAGHYMGDRGTMMAAFAAGIIDVMNPEDKVQFETIQGLRPDLTHERFYGTYGYGLYFAMDEPPFSDVRVRRAINLAADRQDMLTKATFGDGVINPPGIYGWRQGWAIPPEELVKLPGYNPATKQQDIAQAKRLLAEAGYPSGFEAKVSLSAASTNPRPIAEVLASQLKQIGISLTLQPLDRGTLAKVEREETWQLHILGASGRSRSETFDRFHSKGALNKHGPKDPEIDALLEKLLVEFDEQQAQKLHQQFQRRMYDQAYFIGAFERAAYTVYQPWVHDILNNYGANIIPEWSPPVAWMDIGAMPANRQGEKP